MSALAVINSEYQLFRLSDGEKAEGRAGEHFAVLLKANGPGNCAVKVSCYMSDGSRKTVPFEFEIER